jgi:Ca2+-binding EF-hand superfamily protein
MEADKDGDGKISFEEFCQMVASTVNPSKNECTNHQDVVVSMTLEGV